MSKSLYSFFNCQNKEELHQKLLDDDPITQPLKELFNELAKEKIFELGQMVSQTYAANFFRNYHLPEENSIHLLLTNTKNYPLAIYQFDNNCDLSVVAESIAKTKSVKGAFLARGKTDTDLTLEIEGLLDLIGIQLLDHFEITEDGRVYSDSYNMEVLPPGEYKTSQKDLPLIDSKSNVKGERYNHFELDNEITKLGFEDEVLMVSEELNEFRRYHALKTLIGENISNEQMIMKHFKVALQDLSNEHLYIATFDEKYDIQKIHNISIGGVSSTILEPMAVLNHLYVDKTEGFFIVHNHPSGFPDPSEADIGSTQRFVELAKITNKQLAEHYIVAGVGTTKISEEHRFDYDFNRIKQNARKMIADRNAKDVMTINKKLKNAQNHAQNCKGEQLTLDFKNEPER